MNLENNILPKLPKLISAQAAQLLFVYLPWRQENLDCTTDEYGLLTDLSIELMNLDYKGNFIDWSAEYQDKEKLIHLHKQLNLKEIQLLINYLKLQHIHDFNLKLGLYLNGQTKHLINWMDLQEADLYDSAYPRFIEKWCNSPFFILLFKLKYQTSLELQEQFVFHWETLKKEISVLFVAIRKRFGPHFCYNLMYFWLDSLRRADKWNDQESTFKNFCENLILDFTPKSDMIFKNFDYFGSTVASTFLQNFAFFLYHPFALQHKFNEDSLSISQYWLYDKMSVSLEALTKSKKSNLLIQATSDSSKLSNSQGLKILNKLKHYTAVHFMGHFTEILASIFVKSKVNEEADIFFIPGSCVHIKDINAFKQGPDFLLAKISSEKTQLKIHLIAIGEIKSYRIAAKKINQQLNNHLNRLRNAEVFLDVHLENDQAVFFYNKNTINKELHIQRVKIDKLSISKKLRQIALIPARKRPYKTSPFGIEFIELPWHPRAFQLFGLNYIFWVVTNFGRINNPDDYERGAQHFINLLQRLKPEKKYQKSNINRLYDFFNHGFENPDDYWSY